MRRPQRPSVNRSRSTSEKAGNTLIGIVLLVTVGDVVERYFFPEKDEEFAADAALRFLESGRDKYVVNGECVQLEVKILDFQDYEGREESERAEIRRLRDEIAKIEDVRQQRQNRDDDICFDIVTRLECDEFGDPR